MQESILPSGQDVAQLMRSLPIDIASTYEASLGLGGDIWGIQQLDDSRLRILSADFTGHGVGAALNTFRLHSYLQSAPAECDDPARLLAYLNTCLARVLPTGQFATMFAGVVDFAACTLTVAVAASPPALLGDPTTGRFALLDGTGYPLGMNRHATYEATVHPFPPDAALVLYSDALIETPTPPEQFFTPDSLLDLLNDGTDRRQASDIQDRLVGRLREHDDALTDDLTIVVLRHRPEGPTA
jgi:sigma-B regulation protein RsbU (phosphoserine phosphatase)